MAKYEVERFAPKFPPMTFDIVAEGSYDLESDTLILSPAVWSSEDLAARELSRLAAQS